MKIARSSPLAIAGLSAVLGCQVGPIMRTFTLAAQVALPSGRSEVIGQSLRVQAEGLEPLAPSSRYVAWAQTSAGATALGVLRPGEPLAVPFEGALADPAGIQSIQVTEEQAGELPAAPSALLRLRGDGIGGLAYVPVSSAAATWSGQVTTRDNKLDLHTSNLPPLGEGLKYGVWVRFAQSHECEQEGGEGVPAFVSLGALDSSGALDAAYPYLLATIQEMAITVQSDRGDSAAISPVRLLQGAIVLPAPPAGGPVHQH